MKLLESELISIGFLISQFFLQFSQIKTGYTHYLGAKTDIVVINLSCLFTKFSLILFSFSLVALIFSPVYN